ncbi:MAG: hypothetical protein NT137_07380 [Methanomassiliicoccales archaeon]|nr:hypothetical protein [Methanomassiliicoccales archaeon]
MAEDEAVELLFLLVTYAFLGGSIKFIDQAYDEHSFDRRSANLLAILAGVVMGFLMAADSPFSTAFFIAMLISLFMAKKMDNLAFVIGALVAVGSFLLFFSQYDVILLLFPIVGFLLAGFVDEVMDELAHRWELRGTMESFLTYRPFSDIALVIMVLLGVFGWVYLIPYFAFTLAYMFVESVSVNGLRMPIRIRPS